MITLALAQRLLDIAEEAARDRSVPMALAVVDGGGVAVALRRMDGATPIAVETVVAKARTAVWFARPTEAVVEAAERRPTVYSSFLQAAGSGPLVYSMGGIPLWEDGVVRGAIAASGGTGSEDVAVAGPAAAWWREQR